MSQSRAVDNIFDDIAGLGVEIRRLQNSRADKIYEYTPVWTASSVNPAIGNGTIKGIYSVSAEMAWVSISITGGSTTTAGTGAYNLTLPIAARAGIRQTIGLALIDAATQYYYGQAIMNGAASFERVIAGTTNDWGSSTPFAIGNGDMAVISGSYAI